MTLQDVQLRFVPTHGRELSHEDLSVPDEMHSEQK